METFIMRIILFTGLFGAFLLSFIVLRILFKTYDHVLSVHRHTKKLERQRKDRCTPPKLSYNEFIKSCLSDSYQEIFIHKEVHKKELGTFFKLSRSVKYRYLIAVIGNTKKGYVLSIPTWYKLVLEILKIPVTIFMYGYSGIAKIRSSIGSIIIGTDYDHYRHSNDHITDIFLTHTPDGSYDAHKGHPSFVSSRYHIAVECPKCGYIGAASVKYQPKCSSCAEKGEVTYMEPCGGSGVGIVCTWDEFIAYLETPRGKSRKKELYGTDKPLNNLD